MNLSVPEFPRSSVLAVAAALLVMLATPASQAQQQESSAFPEYRPDEQVGGELTIMGGLETTPLPQELAQALERLLPNADVRSLQEQSGLTTDWWQYENSVMLTSARMSEIKLKEFERAMGYEPTALPLAVSAVAVVVKDDNPVAERGLTLAELDAIFSSSQKRGHADLRFWGELRDDVDGLGRPIRIYGPDDASPLNTYFQSEVLLNGEFKPGIVRVPVGSVDIVNTIGGSGEENIAVVGDSDGIGFVDAQALTDQVASIPLTAGDSADQSVPLTPENVGTMSYPLARFVFLYINRPPDGELAELPRELLRFVFSAGGQELITGSGGGHTRIPEQSVRHWLQQANIDLEQ